MDCSVICVKLVGKTFFFTFKKGMKCGLATCCRKLAKATTQALPPLKEDDPHVIKIKFGYCMLESDIPIDNPTDYPKPPIDYLALKGMADIDFAGQIYIYSPTYETLKCEGLMYLCCCLPAFPIPGVCCCEPLYNNFRKVQVFEDHLMITEHGDGATDVCGSYCNCGGIIPVCTTGVQHRIKFSDVHKCGFISVGSCNQQVFCVVTKYGEITAIGWKINLAAKKQSKYGREQIRIARAIYRQINKEFSVGHLIQDDKGNWIPRPTVSEKKDEHGSSSVLGHVMDFVPTGILGGTKADPVAARNKAIRESMEKKTTLGDKVKTAVGGLFTLEDQADMENATSSTELVKQDSFEEEEARASPKGFMDTIQSMLGYEQPEGYREEQEMEFVPMITYEDLKAVNAETKIGRDENGDFFLSTTNRHTAYEFCGCLGNSENWN